MSQMMSWPDKPAEFDVWADEYDGGLDNPIKRMLGSSADQFIAVKARWLLRREVALKNDGLSVLDYGCGVGSLMRLLTELGARANFAGSELSGAMLKQVEKRWPVNLGLLPKLSLQQGVLTPFADNYFDIVIISSVLHHVPIKDRPAVYAELTRVLKPSGRLYVFEHNPRNPLVRHIVAHTPIDRNAILLNDKEVRHGLLSSGSYKFNTEYLMFMPPRISFLQTFEHALYWLPLGAQYVVAARKGI
jgi:ubiquinone/menaquinone biosynthesis C-methylase UbiE